MSQAVTALPLEALLKWLEQVRIINHDVNATKNRPRSLKHCACQWKVRPNHTKCYTCHAKCKAEDLMLLNATLRRKSVPWPPNMFTGDVSCIAPAARNASLQILFQRPRLAIVFATATKPSGFACPLSWNGWPEATYNIYIYILYLIHHVTWPWHIWFAWWNMMKFSQMVRKSFMNRSKAWNPSFGAEPLS